MLMVLTFKSDIYDGATKVLEQFHAFNAQMNVVLDAHIALLGTIQDDLEEVE